MGELKLGSMVKIPTRLIRDHRMVELLHDLKVKKMGGGQFGFGEKETLIVMYRDEGDCIAVPRAYAEEKFSDLIRQHGMDDETSKGVKYDFNWVGDEEHIRRATAKGHPEWAVKQRRFIEKLYQAIVASPVRGSIGEAPTSFGKTICGMRLISLFGRSALVMVHKDFQIGQWKKAAMEWLNLTEDEIGLVKGPKCDYEGKKIVIGMVETLYQHDYPKEFYDYFGVVIGDEVHRLGAAEWSKAMPKFPAEVRIGISATPRRKDGLERVFKWTIGDVGAREREWLVKASIFQIAWPVYIEPRRYGIVQWNPQTEREEMTKTFLSKLVSILTELPKYNQWLTGEFLKAANQGRRILVMSERREHLEMLRAMLDEASGKKIKTGFQWGTPTKAQAEEVKTAQVMFGTFGKVKDALDIPDLDTMFLTTPRSDVEQDIGRILRLEPGKKSSLVVDVVHKGIPVCEDFAMKRMKLYQRKGYAVTKMGKWD